MEQRFYKVRLDNGRVIGPLELDRVRLFIAKGVITGLESARLYPTGEWKDINSFPEIAELLLGKLEGKLAVEKAEEEVPGVITPEPSIEGPPVESLGISLASTEENLEHIEKHEKTPAQNPEAAQPASEDLHEGATMVITPDNEATQVATAEEMAGVKLPEAIEQVAAPEPEVMLERELGVQSADGEPLVDTAVASEKTVVLEKPKPQGLSQRKKKILMIGIVSVALLVLLSPGEQKKQVSEIEVPLRIEMPTPEAQADPQKSQRLTTEAMNLYLQDTVDGYKKAARKLLAAAAADMNNVRAICLLASCYINLVDVTNRDENYFNVVTRLIELARAKGVDLSEMVIADVELYHLLGHPDAAIDRIVEYTKTHQGFGAEMYYYLALSLTMKGEYPDAMKYMNTIDPKAWFGARIPYLYGVLYEKTGVFDEAVKNYVDAVRRSPNHIKSRARLVELYYKKDNLPEASKHADFIIGNRSIASVAELTQAYYFRARMLEIAKRDEEALQDLEMAMRLKPGDPDILLEFYTLRSRLGSNVKDAQEKAKMFHFLAVGEKALHEGDFRGAMSAFVSAREVQDKDPLPLLKIAEVFEKQGDLESAKNSVGKAIALSPGRPNYYPRYITLLTNAYEFDEAAKQLEVFKALGPPTAQIDTLEGDLLSRQERLLEAQPYYKRALKASNADSSIYIGYANLLSKGGAFRDAAFYYGLALRFDPFNADAVIGAAKAIAELQTVDAAVGYVQAALSSSPRKAALLNGIAEIYVRKGNYSEAMKFADNALTADSTYFLAHKTKGDVYAAQEKYKQALDAYLTFSNLAPNDPRGRIERYRIFLKMINLVAAKTEIEKVIAAYPKYPGAYYMLGEVYKEGQNFTSALQAALKEEQNNPSYVPAYVLAGTAYNLNKDYGKALEQLNKAMKMEPGNVTMLLQAGYANHMMKTYGAAKSIYERALSLDQGNPQIHKRLCVLYTDLGDRAQAVAHCKAYLDLFPDAPDRASIQNFIQ